MTDGLLLTASIAMPPTWVIVLTVVTMGLVFLGMRLLSFLREQSERELNALLKRDPALCLERLENNKRLRLVFRRSTLLLYKLECYMQLGDDDSIRKTIAALDKERLAPRDRVQYLQTRLSFFATSGGGEEAKRSRDTLRTFLQEQKADKVERYQKLLREADQIIGVYVDRDVSLRKSLEGELAHTGDDIRKGVLQYRLAKLSHFAGDGESVQKYLEQAIKHLQNTYYCAIIQQAMEDHSVLDRQ